MPATVTRGSTITLDAFFADVNNDAADAMTPQVSIIDAYGATVVSLDTPTNVALGHEQYEFAVPADAPLGAWEAVWFGLIDGDQVGPVEDGFTVVAVPAAAETAIGGMVCARWIDPGSLSCDTGTLTGDMLDLICTAASEVLWALGGRRHGTCTATLRPCRRDLVGGTRGLRGFPVGPGGASGVWHEWGTAWTPMLYQGEWFNVCGHNGGCSCRFVDEFTLPEPMATVDSVMIDGDPFTDFVVDDTGRGRRVAYRTDGKRWPACQDLALEDTEVGTWSVTTHFGEPIPAIGLLAVNELACEYVKAARGVECNLPRRVTEAVRQGIMFRFIDPQTFLKDGKTGLYLCDQFLQIVNPNQLPMRSKVFNPDDYGPRSRVPSGG